ncbi:MAG: CBS domain-containing protein [Acidobacteria bacterium]|nr:CBS domain-containing protein [Acidobacteriota bacterium]
MKVRDLMKSQPRTCTLDDDLGTCGRTMEEVGCGVLPVLDGRRVAGILTDRDICLALADRDAKPSGVKAKEVISGQVFSCRDSEELRSALRTMRERQVRRLPVVNEGGALVGLLSLDDVVLESRAVAATTADGPLFADVALTLKAINQHPLPAVAAG